MRIAHVCINLILVSFLLTACKSSGNYPYFIEGEGVSDVEGNEYETVVIGDQEWMSQNLRTSKYTNGENISVVLGFEDYKVYDNDSSAIDEFGLYYNYSAVEDTSGICPCNWHVPTELDYTKLIEYLGGFRTSMRLLKSNERLENGSSVWINDSPKNTGLNSSGFNALPAGFIFIENSLNKYNITLFWSISNENSTFLAFNIGSAPNVVKRLEPYGKESYYSIRCIKDL
jgi:uncharacterized protein (TIGR02145 family)